MQDKYRAILLSSPMGLDVLADILDMCHFGCTLDPDNKVMVAEYNVGVAILSKCGIFSQGTKNNVVKALSSVMPEELKDKENLI